MTQNEIIEMARQAGFFVKDSEAYSPSVQEDHELTPCLKAFAKLVAEKEREACAKIADEWAVGWPHPSQVIAERIRERT
jgi:hypothetical protein